MIIKNPVARILFLQLDCLVIAFTLIRGKLPVYGLSKTAYLFYCNLLVQNLVTVLYLNDVQSSRNGDAQAVFK